MNAPSNPSAQSGDAPRPSPAETELFATVEDIARSFALDNICESLAAVRRLSAQPETLTLAILGGFKAGKSSFINFLVGEPLLPVGVVPTTAVLTQVENGEARLAEVVFDSGVRCGAAVPEIAHWITEERNPENVKKVAMVEIFTPRLARFSGLTFVDTPGIGSLFLHNSATTNGYLRRIEAAVTAVACTTPLAEHDIKLLEQARELTPRCAVLLTKADLCSEKERAEVKEFVEAQLERLRLLVPVYFWSHHESAEELRRPFVQQFLEPLSAQRDVHAREIASHRVQQLAREEESLLGAIVAAAVRTRSDRHELQHRLDTLKEGPASALAILQRLESDLRRTARAHTQAVLDAQTTPLQEALGKDLAIEATRWHGSLAKAAADYETWLKAALRARISDLSETQADLLGQPLLHLVKDCDAILADFHLHLSRAVAEVLGYSLVLPPGPQFRFELRAPDIALGPPTMFHLDWIWRVTPVRPFRAWFRHRINRKLAWEAEKNLSRLAAQWSGILEDEGHRMVETARAYVTGELATLERLISRAPDLLGPVQRAQERLRGLGKSVPKPG